PQSPQGAPTVALGPSLRISGEVRDVSWYGHTAIAAAVVDASTGEVDVVLSATDGSETSVSPTVSGGAGPVRVAAEQALNPSSTILLEAGGRLYQVPTGGAAPSAGIPGSGAPFYPG